MPPTMLPSSLPRPRLVLAPLVLFLAVAAMPVGSTAATSTAAADRDIAGRTWLPQGAGSWTVTPLSESTWRVAWRSDTALPSTSDRPHVVSATGDDLGPASVGRDGRTVSVVVTGRQPRPADLDVVLSGDRLDVPGDDVASASDVAASFPAAESVLDDDPGAPGPYGVRTSDYELEPMPVAGLRKPVEMVGHVVEPTGAPADRPLVLFLHGRHSVCYQPGSEFADDSSWPCTGEWEEIPGHLGYDYAQRLLASQGFTTVSIRVNGINAQDGELPDGGATARATVVRAHLDHWTTLAATRQVDLSKVVLVGHSRGGEGVNRAAIMTPLGAPYRIVGQLLLGPTDFGSQSAPYVPTVAVLPYCDGDVFDLQGQRYTDVGRDLAPGDTALKSSVLVMGANHNFFNTEWTPGLAAAPSWDDWGGEPTATCGTETADRLSPEEQQQVGATLVAGAARLFARGDQRVLPLFDGSGATTGSLGDARLLSHAVGGGRDVRRPGLDAGRSLPVGAESSLCVAYVGADDVRNCDSSRRGLGIGTHWATVGLPGPLPRELELRWTQAGQRAGLALDRPLDLTGRRLELRVATEPAAGTVPLDVRITDGSGTVATVTPDSGAALPRLPGVRYVRKIWARTLVVDPASVSGPDLTDVVQVELVPRSASGRLWLLDVAAAPSTLPAVPTKRLPYVQMGRARVAEGDRKGVTVVEVPFSVAGPVVRPTSFTVGVFGNVLGEEQRSVDLAPGQTAGVVRIAYRADTTYDAFRTVKVLGWGGPGIGTASWAGWLKIDDDDPMPTFTVRGPRKVREGQDAVWRLKLSQQLDITWFLSGRLVKGRGTAARVDDLDRRWLRQHHVEAPPRTPVHKAHVGLDEIIWPGQTEVVLRVGTRDDDRDEGRETLRMEIRYFDTVVRRTVRIVDGDGDG